MSIFNLFSKRHDLQNGEVPDVYQYDKLPEKFRVQFVHIVKDTIGEERMYNNLSNKVYADIHKILCKEYGMFTLGESGTSYNFSAVYDYFLNTKNLHQCLDIIELSMLTIDTAVRSRKYEFQRELGVSQSPDDAISELNIRFKESGIGYQYESGKVIRIDCNYLHEGVVKPALLLLRQRKEYRGANEEFLKAHEHFRHQRYKECLVECNKAFESLMKAICVRGKVNLPANATSKKLISACFEKGLIPKYLQSHYTSLQSLLECGVPTIRNKQGGHGQGVIRTKVPSHLASFTLHLTAANMLFLAESVDAK